MNALQKVRTVHTWEDAVKAGLSPEGTTTVLVGRHGSETVTWSGSMSDRHMILCEAWDRVN